MARLSWISFPIFRFCPIDALRRIHFGLRVGCSGSACFYGFASSRRGVDPRIALKSTLSPDR